jgi:hypothetical protein
VADHCYWEQASGGSSSCTLYPTIAGLDPGFYPGTTYPWSLYQGLTWLKQAG